jgi:hypothetical protein
MKWVEAQPDADGFGGGGGPEWVEVGHSPESDPKSGPELITGTYRSMGQCRWKSARYVHNQDSD